MKSYLVLLGLLTLICGNTIGQDTVYQNSVNNMFMNEKNLSIRGYAQIDYNQPIISDRRSNGNLEIHRMVLFVGYRFNKKLQFISEIEFEHGDEIFIEQGYVQYKLGNRMNLRGGMMVIPMGIINEFHEPTTFHGVERPDVDGKIMPTTWRELALGINGVIPEVSLKYQLYVTNGFLSHDGSSGVLRGSDGLRKGRQKGLRSTLSSPNISMKLDNFSLRNLKVGLAGYFGKTQSKLYDGLDDSDELNKSRADSSVVGVAMIAADARYRYNGFEFRGVYVFSYHSGIREYNEFSDSDLGSEMMGFYLETAFDLLSLAKHKSTSALLPFIRFEKYNTHADVEGMNKNENFNVREITAGISWRHGTSVSFKFDFQWKKSKNGNKRNQLNAGIGVWF